MLTFWAVLHLFAGRFSFAAIVSIACLVGYFFIPETPLPIVGQLLHRFRTLVLAAGIASGVYALTWADAFMSGHAYAIQQVAAQNQETIHAVNEAKKPLAECRARGGTWDQSDGVCR
jgi:hypothetical protein